MQLRRLAHRIRQRTPRRIHTRNTRRNNENPALRITLKRRKRFTHQEDLGFDIYCVAEIPVFGGRGVQI